MPSVERSEAEEDGTGQGLCQALGQSGLSAAKRTDDVVQGPDVAKLERLAAPRPRQVEGDTDRAGRLYQQREVSCGWSLALTEIGPDAANLLREIGELMAPAFDDGLVRSQSGVQA